MTIDRDDNRDRWRRHWDKHSASYDGQMPFVDRVLFKDSRDLGGLSWGSPSALTP